MSTNSAEDTGFKLYKLLNGSIGWLPLGTAFATACWALVLALFAAGYWACAVNASRFWRGITYGAVISTFGLAIVALRSITP